MHVTVALKLNLNEDIGANRVIPPVMSSIAYKGSLGKDRQIAGIRYVRN